MTNVVVVGAQWGDEGKAKVIDLLAEKADVVVRCQGGCNAGHTVQMNDEVFKFHHLPSGLLYPGKLCMIGSGTVLNPDVFAKEIESIHSRGYSTAGLKVSDRAHITLSFHIEGDKRTEALLAKGKIGTTGRGIGPTYMDKVGRWGIRVADLYDRPENLKKRLEQLVQLNAKRFETVFETQFPTVETLYADCQRYAQLFAPYVDDTVSKLHEAAEAGHSILFEGAQGTLLDVDFGTYPYVTSSNATAGGACTGSGMGPSKIDHVVGVMKAYTTRVGEGPFPTELQDNVGEHLVNVGQEFGTTTGRKRRCGWFDAVIGRYSVMVNGLDSIALTKLDVLTGLDELKICVAYKNPKTGERITHFPARLSILEEMEPEYETFPGWTESLADMRQVDELPEAAKVYLDRIAQLLKTPIGIISIGPDRQQTMVLQNPLTSPMTCHA